MAGSHCLQGWRAGPSPPPLEGVDHSPEGDGGNGAPMPRLGLGSVPLDKPLLPLDQFVQRSKGPRWSSASNPSPKQLRCRRATRGSQRTRGSQFSGHSAMKAPETSSILGPVRPGRKRLRRGQPQGGCRGLSGARPPALQVYAPPPPTPRRVDIHDDPYSRPVAFPGTPTRACARRGLQPPPATVHPHAGAHGGPDRRISVAPSRGHLVRTRPARSSPLAARFCTQGDPGSSPGQKARSKKAQCSSFRRLGSTRFRRGEPVRDRSTQGAPSKVARHCLCPEPSQSVPILWLLKPPVVCFRGTTRSGLSSPATRWPPRSR